MKPIKARRPISTLNIRDNMRFHTFWNKNHRDFKRMSKAEKFDFYF